MSLSKRAEASGRSDKYYIYAKKFCPRRSLDATRLHNCLLKNNLQPVSDPRKADVIFVYTCGGFGVYEERSLLTIEKALENKTAKVIVTGCLPAINPKVLDGYRTAHVASPEELGKLDPLVPADFSLRNTDDCSVVEGFGDLLGDGLLDRVRRNFGFNTRLLRMFGGCFLKRLARERSGNSFSVFSDSTYRLEIARGCLGSCSYCAIKLAMPEFCSFPEERVVENFKSGLKQNFRNFALVAGDIGCYGLDIGSNLPSLLGKLFAVCGDYKILLVDLNVRWFVKFYPELLSVLKPNYGKVARIVMPVQSGSNRILKLMDRHYEIEEVKKCLLDFKKHVPEAALDTHVLVGFPGETEEDFEQSLNLVREVEFSHVEVYSYEDRPGTIASNLPGKVPDDVIKKRIKILMKQVKAQGKLKKQVKPV